VQDPKVLHPIRIADKADEKDGSRRLHGAIKGPSPGSTVAELKSFYDPFRRAAHAVQDVPEGVLDEAALDEVVKELLPVQTPESGTREADAVTAKRARTRPFGVSGRFWRRDSP
jgi:hypothetical protein